MKKLLCLVVAAAIGAAMLNANAAEVTLETIKQLLSSPPCYGYIRYERTEFEENPADDVIWHCEARVCGTNFVYSIDPDNHGFSLLTKITKPNRLRLPISIRGRNSTTRWQMAGDAVIQSINPNEENPDVDTFTVDSNYDDLGELLNLGSRWEILGSFQWEGNQFTAQPTKDSIQMMTTAEPPFSEEEIRRYHSGTIEQIAPFQFKIESPCYGRKFIIYHPDNLLPKNFPNEIRVGATIEDSRRRFLIHEIIPELDTARGDPFDPYTYIDPQIAYRAVISNGVYIVGDKTGKVAPTMENIDPLPNPPQKTLVGLLLFVAIMALAGTAVYRYRKG